MWISDKVQALLTAAQEQRIALEKQVAQMMGANALLTSENAQLRSTVEWMKIRLNSVEKERAQLISAAIGVKVAVPEFMPATDPDAMANALAEMPDLSSIGEDAKDDGVAGLVGTEKGVDYSMMPGYRTRN